MVLLSPLDQQHLLDRQGGDRTHDVRFALCCQCLSRVGLVLFSPFFNACLTMEVIDMKRESADAKDGREVSAKDGESASGSGDHSHQMIFFLYQPLFRSLVFD